MGRMSSAVITRKDGLVCASANWIAGERLWKRRCEEKPKGRLFLAAWESRTHRGIPTFPQPRRRSLNLKPDISCALKSGHFNLLTTGFSSGFSSVFLRFFFGIMQL